MTLEKSAQEAISDSYSFHDMSHVKNKQLLSSIVTKSPPDLYFFCWLGFLKLEKIDIGLPFFDFGKNHVVHQAYMNLTQIRINKKQYDLLEPLRKGYNVKHHDIEDTAINLSTQGRQVWYQAHKDGLWEVLCGISRSFCLEFETFSHFFRSHIFLSRTKYLTHLKTLEKEPEIPLSVEYDGRDKNLIQGLQKLEKISAHSTSRTIQKSSKSREDRLEEPKFSLTGILQTIYSIAGVGDVFNYDKWITVRDIIQNNMTATLYIESAESFPKNRQRNYLRKINKALLKQIKNLYHRQLLEVKYYQKNEKTYYKVRLTLKGVAYTESHNGSTSLFPILSKKLEHFVYAHTSHFEELQRSRESNIGLYSLVKAFILLLLFLHVFLSVIILTFGFQKQYSTPILLLYEFFSWLEPHIYLSSILLGLMVTIPIHFVISIRIFRKKRFSYTFLKIGFLLVAISFIGSLISNLIFLYGF